jgi:cobaltochelatase CobS
LEYRDQIKLPVARPRNRGGTGQGACVEYRRGRKDVAAMVQMANLTRAGFKAGDLSTVMSPRTVIAWAENMLIFNDRDQAFRVSFMNRCDDPEWPTLNEYYQRCFGVEVV